MSHNEGACSGCRRSISPGGLVVPTGYPVSTVTLLSPCHAIGLRCEMQMVGFVQYVNMAAISWLHTVKSLSGSVLSVEKQRAGIWVQEADVRWSYSSLITQPTSPPFDGWPHFPKNTDGHNRVIEISEFDFSKAWLMQSKPTPLNETNQTQTQIMLVLLILHNTNIVVLFYPLVELWQNPPFFLTKSSFKIDTLECL